MKYRSRIEIIAMVLDSANGGATWTKLMYKAFVSYHQLKGYLEILIENELIEYIAGTKTFRTTEKGLIFLRMHDEIGELLHITPTPISSY
jgi:predicted transcriptional regulator